MMKGIVTDIQRFSLNDGAGIRTTVFLKGCNMRCSWCHNPETISAHSQLMFYENKCIGCGKCFQVCPQGAHKMVDGKHVIDRDLCVNCGKCTESCYAEALVMCGKFMSTDDVMKQVRQDKAYYDASHGGVTISGGEVLCNSAFAEELTDKCHKEGIEVAIETNLSIPFEKVQSLFEKVDFVMCDLKIFEDELHKEYTGISNKVVLENMKKLDTLNKPVIVRTPLIPGVTDTKENICAIAEYIKDMKNLQRYELLNFNPLGEGKYRSLDKENVFEKARPLSAEVLQELQSVLADMGIEYKIV